MADLAQIGLGFAVTLGTSAVIGAVAYIRALKKQVHELEKKCEGFATKDALKEVELKLKVLETSDKLQQKAIDPLKEMFPALNKAMEIISQKKR